MISDEAINQEDFKEFVKDLKRKNRRDKLALYMDNLAVHKAASVKELYTSLDVMPLFNIPYSPDTNPIEACFSVMKSHFKRKRLEYLVNGRPFYFPPHMTESIEKIVPQTVQKCVAHSMKKLRDVNFLK